MTRPVDSAYNIHGYNDQPGMVATKIISQNPHYVEKKYCRI